jgi:two-component system OmpR family response regulator
MTESRLRIVLVDDDLDLIERVKQVLEEDYDVVATADWGALNRIFFREGCDLVLMDVNMPVLAGDRLVEILKGKTGAASARPKILFYSAEDEGRLARLAATSGADGYLSKSLRSAELLREIAKHLAGRSRGVSDAPTSEA